VQSRGDGIELVFKRRLARSFVFVLMVPSSALIVIRMTTRRPRLTDEGRVAPSVPVLRAVIEMTKGCAQEVQHGPAHIRGTSSHVPRPATGTSRDAGADVRTHRVGGAARSAVLAEPGLKTAMIVALLGGGWFAYHAVEFHVPASIVEALMPRL